MYESPITTGAGIAGLFWVSGLGGLFLIVVAVILVLIGFGIATAMHNKSVPEVEETTDLE
jgi:hypothetical protein